MLAEYVRRHNVEVAIAPMCTIYANLLWISRSGMKHGVIGHLWRRRDLWGSEKAIHALKLGRTVQVLCECKL